MWLVLLGCRDPILQEIDAVPLPSVSAAGPAGAVPVVAITAREVLLDPTPWGDLLPDAVPARVLALDAPQEHAFGLPALVAAVEPLREAASAADRPAVIAVSAAADVPYRAVVRVLYSLGMAQVAEVELRVATPTGPGAVPYGFPGYCAPSSAASAAANTPPPPEQPVEEPPGPRPEVDVGRLAALLGGDPHGKCVLPTVVEVPDGLVVELDEALDGRAGCVSVKANLGTASLDPAVASDWRGGVVVPGPGACPSVEGRDPAALDALLDRAAALGEPCETATLTALDATPWGEVVDLLVALREHHPSAALAVALDGRAAGCAPSWVLAP